jgi:site-specific recombinase XerD
VNHDGAMGGREGRIFRDVLDRVLNRGGFDTHYLCFHSLRHTFASHWMMKSGDIFVLQKILGHKSNEMTQRYSHLSPLAFKANWSIFGTRKAGDLRGDYAER